MITLLKLLELPQKTMLRKLVLILQNAEIELAAGKETNVRQLVSLLICLKKNLGETIADSIDGLCAGNENQVKRRYINTIRHGLLTRLGIEPSDWDFIDPETGILDDTKRTVFPIAVYLEDIRSPFNVGSIMRTADSFGISRVFISESTPLPTNKRAERTSRGTSTIIPWKVCTLADMAHETGIFALETSGMPIDRFQFPKEGIVLVGSEELGLSPEALSLGRAKSGCVSIPLAGSKRSLNVSVAFGILMEHWFSYLKRDNSGCLATCFLLLLALISIGFYKIY